MKEKNGSEVSERILQVAGELFVDKGYIGTSIRDIASASGANVAHIKYYFDSKSKLFEIVFKDAFDILVDRIFQTFHSDLPFLEMLENWISIYYEILPQYPQIPIFILNEINHGTDTLVSKIIDKNPEKIFDMLSRRMEEEVKKGNIRDIPPLDLGLNILSLSIFPFVFSGFATRVTDQTDEEYGLFLQVHKQHVIDFVMNALRP